MGCLDPFLVTTIDKDENRWPRLENATPQPTFAPQEVAIGIGVAAVSFSATPADDDNDDLIARWLLVADRRGTQDGVVVEMREQELIPLANRGPEAQQYDFTPLELEHDALVQKFGAAELAELTNPDAANPFQLLELRVSDRGFRAGTNDPKEGAGFAYFSWTVHITCVVEGCAQ